MRLGVHTAQDERLPASAPMAPISRGKSLPDAGQRQAEFPRLPSNIASPPTTQEPRWRLAADVSTDVLAQFDAWFTAYRRGENPSLAAGVELSRARRLALKQLIAANPREALDRAIPRSLREELPLEIQAELESPIDAFGAYEVTAGCFGPRAGIERHAEIEGVRYVAHVFGRRLAALSKRRLPLHGIALDDRIAIDEKPYRTLGPSETSPADAGGLPVAVGDGMRTFPTAATLQEWAAEVVAAESAPSPDAAPKGPATAAAPADWTLGEKSVLWIRADFPDSPGPPATDSEIQTSMSRVNDFYLDVSNNRSLFRTVVLPETLRLSRTLAAYNTSPTADAAIRTEAVALARAYDAANGNTGAYNPDRYDRWIVITRRLSVLGVAGRGLVGAAGVFLNGTTADVVVAHELGHNHGLHHADGWRPAGAPPAGPGEHWPYGDVFDIMGSALLLSGGHFSSKAKDILLYLPVADTPAVTASGTYRIFRHDDRNASGVRALRIAAGSYEYWIEHRQLLPTNTFSAAPRLRNGVLIRWSKYPATLPGLGTCLLDATPGSPAGGDLSPGSLAGFDDAALTIGETFTDTDRGISITPLTKGGAAPNEWIDVRIAIGAINAGDNRNPVLNATPPFAVLPARTDIRFTASASDPDGDPVTIRWEFGDGQTAPSGGTVTKRFVVGGNYTIRCTATDGRGGLATKSFEVSVDDPLLTWTQRGQGVTTLPLYAVINDGRQFIAAGSSVVLTSADGMTWTRRTSPASETYLAMAHGNSHTVAAGIRPGGGGSAPLGALAFTADGITWRSVTGSLAPDLPMLNAVAFGDGGFVAVGNAGALLHSREGVGWTRIATGVSHNLMAVAFAAGRFVVVGANGTVLTSTDGTTWQNRSLLTTLPLQGVAFVRNTWLVTSGVSLWASVDGIDWTSRSTAPFGVSGVFGFTALGSSDLLLSNATNDRVHISEDGSAWSSFVLVSPPTTGSTRSACLVGDRLVMVGNSGRIFTTTLRSAAAVAPAITAELTAQFVPSGEELILRARASGAGLTYRWFKDGAVIVGETGATLRVANAQPADNGTYAVAVTNFGGTTSSSAGVSVDPNTARLANLSIRTRAGTGADTLTLGFVIAPTFYTSSSETTKRILTRGIGPTLSGFGVTDALADPRIEFFRGSTRTGGNDDWGGAGGNTSVLSDAFNSVGAFALSPNSRDAAALDTFSAAAYSVQLTGPGSATGVALAELYDLDARADGPRLVNASARCAVGRGTDVLIAGFSLKGAGTRTLLIRAVGPTLAAFGVTGTLADPILHVRSGAELLSENDNWGNATAVSTAAAAVGAFSLATSSKDAALLVTLPAGSYTAQVSGVGETTGVALVEIYEILERR